MMLGLPGDLPRKVLGDHWETALNAYLGSLDAAKALHKALLPGWIYDLTNGSCFVCASNEDEASPQFIGESDEDSRAWLLAILRAHAQEAGL